jgi:hypothetical protein
MVGIEKHLSSRLPVRLYHYSMLADRSLSMCGVSAATTGRTGSRGLTERPP